MRKRVKLYYLYKFSGYTTNGFAFENALLFMCVWFWTQGRSSARIYAICLFGWYEGWERIMPSI